MRITRILPLSLLIASCAPAARPPVASHQPSPPVLSDKTVTHFPSLREAIRAAIKEAISSKSRTIALGEVHNKDRGTMLPTSIDYFAHQVVPEIAAAKCQHVLFENLPFGAEADKEIEQFKNDGKLGPILSRHIIESSDCRGIIQTLIIARKLGITLHGLHFTSYEEYKQRVDDGTSGDIIKQRIAETIQRLRETDKNMLIVVFGGLDHNNITGDLSLSIAHMFLPRFKEVDILLGRNSHTTDEADVDFHGWETHIPLTGANLIDFPSGRIIIALPDNDPPLTQPTCPEI